MERKFTDAELVKAWLVSNSQHEVAKMLGVTQGPIARRARRLRKAGVLLPQHDSSTRPNRPVDVDGLNKLIAERTDEAG